MLVGHPKSWKDEFRSVVILSSLLCLMYFPAITLDEWTEKEVMSVVNLNAIFPLRLTRVLLPQLRAAKGPTLVIFVGSISADIAIQRFGVYGSSKNFVQSLSRCLDVDERWPFGSSSNISFMYAAVGEVVSNTMRVKPHLFTPTSERFAKAFVARIGCGQRRITPWMPHAVQQWAMTPLGESVVEMFSGNEVAHIMKQEIKTI
jgi:17beta-estradiol 17-dehydrogenase / very-long-chain 3-oxoacyl-CoA reductase